MIKLPTWASVVLAFATYLVFFLLVLGNKLDFLYPFFIYPLAIVVGWLVSGFTYGLLPGKKAIDETKRVKNFNNSTEADAPSAHDRAMGYWKWVACCLVIPLLVTIGYHLQLAGYW